MKPDKFIAIDFETANRNMASACAIGIVVFQEGVLTYKESFLIRPHQNLYSFDPSFIDIHHIRPEDVAEQPEFDQLWPMIREIIKDGILVAHNASFDMTVLMSLINLYKLEYDHFSYFCTVKLSRSAFKFLPSHRLNIVS
ncbi:MAG: DNA polymerase III subunit epsilon, partial [Firmicutes bacterium HGW-Firmicutes-20]